METQHIVRGGAEAVTITRLVVGDVYKRVEESSYGSGATLRYGVVTDVMDNGPDAAVVALEFRPAEFGSGVVVETKIITGNQPFAIFPATPDEVRDHMQSVMDAAQAAERTAEEAYAKAQGVTERVRRLARDVTAGALTVPATHTPQAIETAVTILDADDHTGEVF